MNKKTNRTIKIVCGSDDLVKALFGYIKSSEGQIKQSLDNHLRSSGKGNTDVTFEDSDPDKLVFRLSSNPTDKGDVLALNESGELSVVKYTELSNGDYYGFISANQSIIYRYSNEGVDTPINIFGSISDLGVALVEIPKYMEAQEKASKEAVLDKINKSVKEHLDDGGNESMESASDSDTEINESDDDNEDIPLMKVVK